MTLKQEVLTNLNKCEPSQIKMFLRMYSHKNVSANAEDVINSMPHKKLKTALVQINRTIEKNKLPKQKPIKPEPIPEPTISERILPVAIEAANDSFYNMKNESPRKIVGGGEEVDFEFEGKKYIIKWNGFWEKSDWYDYEVSGNGVNLSGTKYK